MASRTQDNADRFLAEARGRSTLPQTRFAADSRTTYETLVIIGPSGFGKTSLVDELQEDFHKRTEEPVWICDPANNWPHHPGRFWPGLEGLDATLTRFRSNGPGLLIFDDADLYYRHPTGPRLELIVANRHWQKHVMMVARRPQGIPKDIFQIADNLALFHQRQVYAREYIAAELEEPRVAREIPRERFRYLYVNRDTGARAVFSTKARAVKTASDIG